MKKIFQKLKANSPTILCCLAAVGVISTVITAVKATPKATKKLEKARGEKQEELSRKEIFKTAATCYIPTAILGVTTIGCIFGANVLNKHKQAMLTTAYGLIQSNYRRYSGEVKKLFGKDAHFEDIDEEEKLFYDVMSKRYFKSTISRVLLAEYHLNRNFTLGAAPDQNMFYDFLGIEPVEHGDCIGWDYAGGIYWIDFEHIKNTTDDGLEYYIINPIFWPEPFETYPTE